MPWKVLHPTPRALHQPHTLAVTCTPKTHLPGRRNNSREQGRGGCDAVVLGCHNTDCPLPPAGSQWSLSDQIFLFTPPDVQVADLKMQSNSLAEAIRTMLHPSGEVQPAAVPEGQGWGGEWDEEGADEDSDLSFLYQR